MTDLPPGPTPAPATRAPIPPWRRAFEFARDPLTARNALGLGNFATEDGPPSDGNIYGWQNGQWIAIAIPIWSTGDTKLTFKTVADPGWVMMNDGSIGDASSGATTRANADCQALFTLFFANCADADVPLQTKTGAATTRAAQGTAAAAWGAHCRIVLPKVLGRALAGAGAGAGLTNRPLGSSLGTETHTMSGAEMASHTHSATVSDPTHSHSASVSDAGHTHGLTNSLISAGVATPYTTAGAGSLWSNSFSAVTATGYASISASIGAASTGISVSLAPSGSGAAFSIMSPTSYLNVMVCL